jgi:hypothetical protein
MNDHVCSRLAPANGTPVVAHAILVPDFGRVGDPSHLIDDLASRMFFLCSIADGVGTAALTPVFFPLALWW